MKVPIVRLSQLLLPVVVLFAISGYAQVVDVHMHCYTEEGYWGGRESYTGISSPSSAREHMEMTIAEMNKHNIQYAVISGLGSSVSEWMEADSRFIPGYMDDADLLPVEEFEAKVKTGEIQVFGEITGVYFGKTLSDSMYAPYLEVCERYEIPVAYHTGGGPPGSTFRCCPNMRLEDGDPFLIEEVLIRHPKLKVYLMHAGEVFFEHSIRMMNFYPELYVDLGILLHGPPLVRNYAVRFLSLAKETGVLDRVMFGSDQMVWPGAISESIEFLNSMEFLTQEEKDGILYGNAMEFLNLK